MGSEMCIRDRNAQIALQPFTSVCTDGEQDGAAEHDEIGAECACADDIIAMPDAAIENQWKARTDC